MQVLVQQLKSNSEAWIGLIREEARAAIENMAAANGGAYAFNENQINQVASIIGHRVGENEASITRADRAIADIDRALAEIYVGVLATVPGASAESLYQLIASAGPEGAIVALEERLRAGFGGVLAEAARGMEVYSGEGGAFSRLWFRGDRFDVIDGQGNRRNALLFPVADEQEVPITVEGSTNVIRPDLSGRVLRHYCLLDDDAELRAPVGAVPMDYTVRVEQDETGDREISASDEFLNPKPELSGPALLPGAISVIEHSILSINPMRIAATVREPFTETPTVALRDYKGDSRVSTSSSGAGAGRIEGLDFVPGNYLLAICVGFIGDTTSPLDPGFNISPAAVEDWSQIVGQHLASGGGGGNWQAMGVRAFWKIATGSEGDLQAFIYTSGASARVSGCNYHFLSFDFLGGALSACPDPSNTIGGPTGTFSQTIKTDGFAPSLAFSLAAAAHRTSPPPSPDQSFGETPDENFLLDSSHPVRSRLKIKQFNDAGSDVTTSYDGASVHMRSLLSFGIKME